MFDLTQDSTACKCGLILKSKYKREFLNLQGNKDSKILVLFKSYFPKSLQQEVFNYFKKYQLLSGLYSYGFSVGCISGKPGDSINYNYQRICKDYNIKKMILDAKPNVIIAEGWALRTIVEKANITSKSFHNFKNFKSYFYSPEFNSWIIPIPEIESWVDFNGTTAEVLDNFYSFFIRVQIAHALNLQTHKTRIPKINLEYVEDPNQFLRDNWDKTEMSFDFETTGLKFYEHKPFCWVTSFDGKTGYYIDWDMCDIPLLNSFLKDKKIYMANGNFDLKMGWYHGLPNLHNDFDVNYAGHILNSGRSNGLKEQTYYNTLWGGYDNELDRTIDDFKLKSYADVPKNIMIKYAAMDAVVTFHLAKEYEQKFSPEQSKYFYDIYMPVTKVMANVEYGGFKVDIKYIIDLRDKYSKEITHIKHEIQKIYPITNISSGDEVKGMFIGHFKQKSDEVTDKGEVSIGEKTLKRWQEEGKEVVSKLATLVLRYRWLDKNISSFLSDGTIKKEKTKKYDEKYLDIEIDEYDHTAGKKKKTESTILQNIDKDGILHAGFNMQRVKTYRFSSSNINLQQIPIKSNPEIRPIFRPSRPGNVLAEIDYAAIHLRIAAMFSQDPVMVKLFSDPISSNRDMHSKTAASVFTDYTLEQFQEKRKNGTLEEKSRMGELRNTSKAVNFGLIYMCSFFTLCETSLKLPISEGGWSYEKVCDFINTWNISYEQAKNPEIEKDNMYLACAEFIRNRFSSEYHVLWEHQLRTVENAKRDGYVKNLYGIKIYLPEFIYPGHEGQNKAYSGYISDASNYGILSTEAYIMQRSMVEMDAFFKKNRLNCRFVNQVHDSVLLDLGEDLLENIKDPIKEIMIRDYPEYKGIHLDVEGEWFKFWGGKDKKDETFDESYQKHFWFE